MAFNKKGLENQIIMLFVMMGVLMAIILAYFAYSLVAPPLTHTVDTANTVFQSALPVQNNLSTYGNLTFGSVNQTIQVNMEWISYGALIMMLLAFVFVSLFVRTYPFLLIFWILFIIIMVFCSFYLTVTYQNVSSGGGYLGDSYHSWQVNDFIMGYQTQLVVAFGLISGVILFILATRDNEAEAGFI